jgi:hypothetical protein
MPNNQFARVDGRANGLLWGAGDADPEIAVRNF